MLFTVKQTTLFNIYNQQTRSYSYRVYVLLTGLEFSIRRKFLICQRLKICLFNLEFRVNKLRVKSELKREKNYEDNQEYSKAQNVIYNLVLLFAICSVKNSPKLDEVSINRKKLFVIQLTCDSFKHVVNNCKILSNVDKNTMNFNITQSPHMLKWIEIIKRKSYRHKNFVRFYRNIFSI